MSQHKKPERRTFIQDRFDILIRRQQAGKATFAELTELDEIVNRDPELREKVFRENMFTDGPDDQNDPISQLQNEAEHNIKSPEPQSWWARAKAFLSGLFVTKLTVLKSKLWPVYPGQAILL
jgi:hypothetical protein